MRVGFPENVMFFQVHPAPSPAATAGAFLSAPAWQLPRSIQAQQGTHEPFALHTSRGWALLSCLAIFPGARLRFYSARAVLRSLPGATRALSERQTKGKLRAQQKAAQRAAVPEEHATTSTSV